MAKMQSAERVSGVDSSDNYVYQRSLLAYHKAAATVSGRVLEVGTGSGYGLAVVAPRADKYVTIDKAGCPVDYSRYTNVEGLRMRVPPLTGLADDSFDYAVMFQVIEHIKDDALMISELHRVLRPGGRLLISTPNRLTSLTRNPWHVREYTPGEFDALLRTRFETVEGSGVFGNDKVMEYYAKNRESVRRIRRLDPLGLEKRLPRRLLCMPYDVLNRINRRRLLAADPGLTTGITMDDYSVAPVGDNCFDLLYTATK